MIVFFSGTGNSKYAAERISEITGESIMDIGERIRKKDSTPIKCDEKLIVVVPTYAWRIPRIVSDLIRRTEFTGADKVWFVMTCGGEIGNAAKYNRILCEKKGFTYMGTAQILMPENYIAMFNAPEWKEAEKIISAAEKDIVNAGNRIKAGEAFDKPRNNLYDRLMSSAVNPMFYDMYVKADAFYAKDNCTGCGKCAKLCPLGNIKIENGKPVWGKDCTHCMACICYCPAESIEYGKKSQGKPRYRCRLIDDKEGKKDAGEVIYSHRP